MKSEEFPTTRVDWRNRARQLLRDIEALGPNLAEDFVADVLADLYDAGECGKEHCTWDDGCCDKEHT